MATRTLHVRRRRGPDRDRECVWLDLPPHVASRQAFRGNLSIFLSCEAAIIILIGSGAYAARDLYEAALPLDGRDIWLSRFFALLSVVWLPAAIGIAGGLPPVTLLAGASVTTLLILCVACYRIREFGMSKPLGFNILRIVLIVPAYVVLFGRPLRSVHWLTMPPAWSVLTVSGLLSLLVFLSGLRSVPKAFSAAPRDAGYPARDEADKHMDKPPRHTLAPVLRSVYLSKSMLVLFGLVVGCMAYGNFEIAIIAVIPLGSIFASCRWLLALPISRRKLFALVATAPTVAVTIGALAAALVSQGGSQTLAARVADFAVELASVYLALFLLEFPDWRPLSRLRTWVKWVPFGIASLTFPMFSARNIFDLLAHADPSNSWPLFFLLPVAAYRLAEKAFIEQEYPRPLIQTNHARCLSA